MNEVIDLLYIESIFSETTIVTYITFLKRYQHLFMHELVQRKLVIS